MEEYFQVFSQAIILEYLYIMLTSLELNSAMKIGSPHLINKRPYFKAIFPEFLNLSLF